MILTAAYCVKSVDPSTLVVRCGEWDTQQENEVLDLMFLSQDMELTSNVHAAVGGEDGHQ